jgi:hypothetical protein
VRVHLGDELVIFITSFFAIKEDAQNLPQLASQFVFVDYVHLQITVHSVDCVL